MSSFIDGDDKGVVTEKIEATPIVFGFKLFVITLYTGKGVKADEKIYL
jgi:hypothetical protein